MSKDLVLLDVDPRGVATLSLNRPDVNNAYNGELIAAFGSGLTRCVEDDSIRVVLVRGEGKHFQAGADLRWVREMAALGEAENLEASWSTARAVRDLLVCPKPTVALVHGGCFGGGVGIVAACDVVVAEESAMFALSEVRWGLMPGIIIPQLNAAIGVRQVRRLALGGERFGARQAQALGLVHEICEVGGLDACAAPIVDALIASAPGAMAETKQATLADAGLALDDAALEALVVQHARVRRSTEAEEGLASFDERRKPYWYSPRQSDEAPT